MKKKSPNWEKIISQLGDYFNPVGRPNVKSEFLTKNLDIKFGGKP